MPHVPVLLKEVITYLDPKPGEFIVDGTLGSRGHSIEIVKHISPSGTLLGVDWDREMIVKSESQTAPKQNEFVAGQANRTNAILVQGNYADLPEILAERKLPKPDGLLLDLGFSSVQLHAGKGFSFDRDEPLLMTYNDERTPAKTVLREIDEATLARIIREYGGERMSKRIARAIKERVREKGIETSGELADAVRAALPRNYERSRRRGGAHRIDPATRTFQALRIYVNDELGNLEKILRALPNAMNRNGRVVIISFHSLEDRLVKNYFKAFEREGIADVLTKKPVRPHRSEIENNPRSRSAKLRALQVLCSTS
ncbi:MAG: 16S rRNA (cytosine(1402)-N(4))-methyltransferase RsmH [Candidatus Liptonbacteria bacterium]|nr:16S rRNA (cytosine(1402)-N(4))-methyltransferase RsmH [Candidatus Liptonbacteria bacterium]